MQIRDMPRAERPREKMQYYGPASLSTAELLALVIGTGTVEKSAVQLAEDVLSYAASEFGSLGNADVAELTSIPGVGIGKACSIAASVELGRRIINGGTGHRSQVRNADDAARLMMDELRGEKREHFVELILNAKCEVEAKETISIGGLVAADVHPREAFAPAIRKGAYGVLFVHNHPSGDPTPSGADLVVTERLIEAGRILGIKVMDHIVTGDGRYVSLRTEGLVDFGD